MSELLHYDEPASLAEQIDKNEKMDVFTESKKIQERRESSIVPSQAQEMKFIQEEVALLKVPKLGSLISDINYNNFREVEFKTLAQEKASEP